MTKKPDAIEKILEHVYAVCAVDNNSYYKVEDRDRTVKEATQAIKKAVAKEILKKLPKEVSADRFFGDKIKQGVYNALIYQVRQIIRIWAQESEEASNEPR